MHAARQLGLRGALGGERLSQLTVETLASSACAGELSIPLAEAAVGVTQVGLEAGAARLGCLARLLLRIELGDTRRELVPGAFGLVAHLVEVEACPFELGVRICVLALLSLV